MDILRSDDTGGAALADAEAVPSPSAIYAVGDIHGCADSLGDLLDRIESDAVAKGQSAHVVFLGDLVNRGPQSKQVIDILLAGPRRSGDRWTVLRGNHDQLMVDALRGGKTAHFRSFLSKGGVATLASYGLSPKQMTLSAARALVPKSHLDFLDALPFHYVCGTYLFVHAGVKPGVALEKQARHALMNIRENFLTRDHGLPFTVVHGHSPTVRPVVTPHRIGIDTGACNGGMLTAVALDQGALRFLQASSASLRARAAG
jgi:serine/threonine protein phosphatase 1